MKKSWAGRLAAGFLSALCLTASATAGGLRIRLFDDAGEPTGVLHLDGATSGLAYSDALIRFKDVALAPEDDAYSVPLTAYFTAPPAYTTRFSANLPPST
jgi:hypothetical protein